MIIPKEEEDQHDWRIGEALDFRGGFHPGHFPREHPFPLESALLSLWIFGLPEFSPGLALLPCRPPSPGVYHSFSFCQQGRCATFPPQRDFRRHWTCFLHVLAPGPLRSLEEPHSSSDNLSLWTGRNNSDLPLLCPLRPVAAQLTCDRGAQGQEQGCGCGASFRNKAAACFACLAPFPSLLLVPFALPGAL